MIFLIVCLWRCKEIDNQKITFLSLNSSVLIDSFGKQQLDVKYVVEYRPNSKVLTIGIKEGNYTYEDSLVPKFGLDKFYTYKIDSKFNKVVNYLFENEYNDEYYIKHKEPYCDDRRLKFIIIEKNNIKKVIFYKDREKLPKELFVADSLIYNVVYSKHLDYSKNRICYLLIKELQDTLFSRFPPPKLIKSSIKFSAPIIKIKDNN